MKFSTIKKKDKKEKMTQAISKSNKEFIRESIEMGIREDGRQMLEMRNMKLIFSKKNDGVEVSLGKTKVFAKISSKIIEPSKSKPSEGKMRFIINLKLMRDTKQGFLEMNDNDLSTEISKVLERSIRGSK